MSLQEITDLLWAKSGLCYYGFSRGDFENEKYYWKTVDPTLCNLPTDIFIDGQKISTYLQLLDFLAQKSNEGRIEIPDELMGLKLAKKLTFLPPKSPAKPIEPRYSNREYSKRLKETSLDDETKRSILSQVKDQTGMGFYDLSIKDLKEVGKWAEKISPMDIKINFVSGLSSATYKFKKLTELIDFLCAIDCTKVKP